MTFSGMDTDAIARLESLLRKAMEDIRATTTELARELDATAWEGEDAKTFRSKWASESKPSVNRVADTLQQAIDKVRREMSDQRRASGS